jgi:FolB domain-containing protein
MDAQRSAESRGDLVVIRDLLLRGIVGINERERRKRQDILLNLELLVDTRAVAANDDVDRGVNYRTVAKEIIAFVEASRFRTVERLAEEVARIVLTGHAVAEVRISVEKPGALRFARSVGVTIVRRPADFA